MRKSAVSVLAALLSSGLLFSALEPGQATERQSLDEVPGLGAADRAGPLGADRRRADAACQFSGKTIFTPPLKSESQPFHYRLKGRLSSCSGGESGAPLAAKVSAGRPDTTIQGVEFDQREPNGVGGCREASARGTLWVVWSDGGVTIVDYETSGVLASLTLSGEVVPRKRVLGTDGRRHTLHTTRYRGRLAEGALLTQPDDATACSGDGVKVSTLDGPMRLVGDGATGRGELRDRNPRSTAQVVARSESA